MNDFLIYAARLQDAGIERLSVSLFAAKDRTRMMMVTPHESHAAKVHERWPARHFELSGVDRLLKRLKDDMSYSDDGVTSDKIAAAIAAHPHLADDLREWHADLLANPMPTDAELDAELSANDKQEIATSAEHMTSYVKGLMRGMDSRRESALRKGTP